MFLVFVPLLTIDVYSQQDMSESTSTDAVIDTSKIYGDIYQRIHEIMKEPFQEGDPNVYNAIERDLLVRYCLKFPDDKEHIANPHLVYLEERPELEAYVDLENNKDYRINYYSKYPHGSYCGNFNRDPDAFIERQKEFAIKIDEWYNKTDLKLENDTRYFGTYIGVNQPPWPGTPLETYWSELRKNHLAILENLELIGARNIIVLQTDDRIYALIPIDKVLGLSSRSYVGFVRDWPIGASIMLGGVQPIIPLINPTQNNTNTSSTISITLPESMALDNTDRTIDLNTHDANKIRIDTYYSDTATRYYINNIADITIHRDTEILGKTFTYGADQYCYSGDLKVNSTIPNIDMPITPTNMLYLQFDEHSIDRCDQAPDINLDEKMDLDTNVYVRFANSIDKNPFYYANGNDNVTGIPKCSSENFDSTDNALLDDTEICYGKDGNDIILVSKILAVFGVTPDDISDNMPSVQPDPPEQPPVVIPDLPEQPANPTLPINVQDYQRYSTIIDRSNVLVHDDIRSLYSAMPYCDKRLDKTSHSISMTSDRDIILNFSTKKDLNNGKVFITIKNDSKIFSSVSLETVFVEESEGYHYTSTIPNTILDTTNQYLGITAALFTSSNTIHNAKIYSSSSTGSPLFYHYNNGSTPITIQLPPASEGVSFKSDTIKGVNGTVYTPRGSNVSLSDNILCQFGVFKPKQVARIFDMSISASNSTDGLELEYTFEKRQFPSGKEQRPSQIHWIATNSTDTITGNTVDKIKNRYTFTIPLTVSDNYDIILYGTSKQGKLLGVYSDSLKFVSPDDTPQVPPAQPEPPIVPDPPEQPPVVVPDPPEPVEPIDNSTDSETIIIDIPESMEIDNTGRTIDLNAYDTNMIRIDTYYADMGTKYYTNDIADITIFRDTDIVNKQFTTTQDTYCYVGDLFVGQDANVPLPNTNTLQLQFRQSNDPTRCDQSPDITFDDKLELSQEVYVRFAGTDGQTPFYYIGDDIVEIPKCNSNNFDDTSSTLIDNTEICYGKFDNDTILVSKILAVFGTTADDL